MVDVISSEIITGFKTRPNLSSTDEPIDSFNTILSNLLIRLEIAVPPMSLLGIICLKKPILPMKH